MATLWLRVSIEASLGELQARKSQSYKGLSSVGHCQLCSSYLQIVHAQDVHMLEMGFCYMAAKVSGLAGPFDAEWHRIDPGGIVHQVCRW